MNLNEQTLIVDNVPITFIRKPAKKDTKHLIFVFSGFSGDGKPTYNWNNILVSCPAEIIWIKDFFDGGESYYICSQGKLNIESSIVKFLDIKLEEQNLTKSDCTLMGGSKGGAAALYYAMKYNFRNLITIVPQFFIGSYVEIDWPYAFNHMMQRLDISAKKQLQFKLDQLIPNAIKSATLDKNIYLITSHADPQFATEVQPNLHLLDRFENFNLIFSDSDLVTRHNQVNRHTVSVTLSLANLLSMGLPPKFKDEMISYRSKSTEGSNYLKPLYGLKKLNIEKSRLFIEGFAFIQGIPCPEYSDISFNLILKNLKETHKIVLAKGNRPRLNDEIGLKSKTAYFKGWFCTSKYAGISLDDFPIGQWQCFLEINAKGIVSIIPLTTDTEINIQVRNANNSFNICTENSNIFLNVEK